MKAHRNGLMIFSMVRSITTLYILGFNHSTQRTTTTRQCHPIARWWRVFACVVECVMKANGFNVPTVLVKSSGMAKGCLSPMGQAMSSTGLEIVLDEGLLDSFIGFN
mmetsp:Transcript_32866/g.75675  ORF Transcript_32866/g.75675 Transcript_32866/m.75675 type:complete len:107 (+) Transcript_32866:304-624(+)